MIFSIYIFFNLYEYSRKVAQKLILIPSEKKNNYRKNHIPGTKKYFSTLISGNQNKALNKGILEFLKKCEAVRPTDYL